MSGALLEKVKQQQFGKLPVVIVPLAQWREMEAIIEEYEMMCSLNYRKSIAASRKQIKQGKTYHLNLRTGRFKKVRKP